MRIFFSFLFTALSLHLLSQASLVYGPYLQQGGPNSMLVAWRTSTLSDTKLSCGTSSTNLNIIYASGTPVTTHTVLITGLTPNTKYYYSVTNAANTFTSNTFYFYTAPLPQSGKKIRFVATGDCGTALATQTNVRNAVMYYVNGKYINGWLLLGDNAYDNGTDAEYTGKFFAPYQNTFLMHHTALFPVPGNHDYANTASLAENKITAYYDIFDSPTAGQLGGLASNTEAYYSYNYGNIHFIALDSYGTETSLKMYDTTGSVQYQWLKQDLSQNASTWTIIYFHHPPYTMGSHTSDTELELVAIREKMTPLFESKNVDVVLNGHSHNLERSWLIKGHTGLEATFSKTVHAADTSSARYDGTPNSCPYIKDSLSNKGVVYAVCGSSGRATFTQSTYPHDAMYYSNTLQGMAAYIEADSNRLDVRFIGEDSLVHDHFTVFKNVNKSRTFSVPSSQSVTVKASWNGNYLWTNNGAVTKQNTFSLLSNTVILVKDSLNCIADTFKINVIPLGIKLNRKKELKVYPNPVNGNVLNIEMEDPSKVRAVSIIDMKGRMYDISFAAKDSSQLQLKVPELESGAYILKIETKAGVLKQKLILGQK
jgi:acid phosphatase type 7